MTDAPSTAGTNVPCPECEHVATFLPTETAATCSGCGCVFDRSGFVIVDPPPVLCVRCGEPLIPNPPPYPSSCVESCADGWRHSKCEAQAGATATFTATATFNSKEIFDAYKRGEKELRESAQAHIDSLPLDIVAAHEDISPGVTERSRKRRAKTVVVDTEYECSFTLEGPARVTVDSGECVQLPEGHWNVQYDNSGPKLNPDAVLHSRPAWTDDPSGVEDGETYWIHYVSGDRPSLFVHRGEVVRDLLAPPVNARYWPVPIQRPPEV